MPSDNSVSLTEGLSIHMLLIMTKQIETGTDIKFLPVFGFVSSNINLAAILSDTNFLHLLSLSLSFNALIQRTKMDVKRFHLL